jgi:hypothetical protein
MAKKSLKKAEASAAAPFDAKNLAHTAVFDHAEKREHVGFLLVLSLMTKIALQLIYLMQTLRVIKAGVGASLLQKLMQMQRQLFAI